MNGLVELWHRYRKGHNLGLLTLAALLVGIHTTLVLRCQSLEQFNLCMLIWVALITQLRERSQPIQLGSDRCSCLWGTLLLVLVLLKVPHLSSPGLFLSLLPLFLAVGFSLIAVGRSRLVDYWKELGIVAVLAIPGERALAKLLEVVLMSVSQDNLATLTAKFVIVVLGGLGFPVSLQGTEIILANTIVHVDEGCSGARGMDFLLRLALVALLLFSAHKYQRILIPISAVAIAFIVNGIRASIMAYLANQGNMVAFNYWHVGDGSQLFGLAAVLCFVGVCYRCLRASTQPPTSVNGDQA